MADLTHIQNFDARKYFQRELDEHGSVGHDQIQFEKLEEDSYAIDIYDPELSECETALYSSEEEAKREYESLLKLCRPTKLYKVPCSWQMYGYTEVRAESLEEAVEMAEGDEYDLPVGTYVEGSFELDHALIEDMMEEEA